MIYGITIEGQNINTVFFQVSKMFISTKIFFTKTETFRSTAFYVSVSFDCNHPDINNHLMLNMCNSKLTHSTNLFTLYIY